MEDEMKEGWTLTAPGIHGEHVPMRDLSREEADFCIVGAGEVLICMRDVGIDGTDTEVIESAHGRGVPEMAQAGSRRRRTCTHTNPTPVVNIWGQRSRGILGAGIPRERREISVARC